MTLALFLGLLGLLLSAFFSGVETGFYRVTRVRLRLDALAGQRVAQRLWWLINRPTLFVATTLVGNNLANYLVSLAIVMFTQTLSLGGHAVELIATLLLAPVVFVYGELLPKHLFYQAPNRLLRRSGPWFLGFAVLLAPLSALLACFSKLLELISGESHPQVQMALARRELQSVLDEGHEAGILRPAQRQLAQGLFAVANEPVAQFAAPSGRIAHARADMTKAEVLRLARRHRLAALPVEETGGQRRLIGYVRVADLQLGEGNWLDSIRPLLDIPRNEPHIAALVRLHNAGETMARVVGDGDVTVGLITTHMLGEPLFGGGR